jgi:hypothetical protein
MEAGCGHAGVGGRQEKGRWLRPGMSPLGRDRRPAAIVVATTGIADDLLPGFGNFRVVAAMNRLANAAGVRRGRRSRQRQWGKISHAGQEKQ